LRGERPAPLWGAGVPRLVSGIVGILFGIVLIASPAAGALTLLWVIGGFALVFGVVLIVWAFRLRGAARELVSG